MANYTWTDGESGGLPIRLRLDEARACSHPGQCDGDVTYLRQSCARVRNDLRRMDPAELRECLRHYGAWDAEELADHDENLQRVLWIACCDVAERPSEYRN